MEKKPAENKKKKIVKVTIHEEWCKKCGICDKFCPTGVFVSDEFGMPSVKFPEKCIKCMLCVVRCPDFCIEVEEVDKDEEKNKKA